MPIHTEKRTKRWSAGLMSWPCRVAALGGLGLASLCACGTLLGLDDYRVAASSDAGSAGSGCVRAPCGSSSSAGTGGTESIGMGVGNSAGDTGNGAGVAGVAGVAGSSSGADAGGDAAPPPNPMAGRPPFVLATLVEGNGGGFYIPGPEGIAGVGIEVRSGHDTNGDGLSDLLLSSVDNGGGGAGQLYVVWGHERTAPLSLVNFVGQGRGHLITAAGRNYGASLALVGDVNLDGRADILSTSPNSPGFPEQVGTGSIVFGNQVGSTVSADTVGGADARGYQLAGAVEGGEVAGVGDQNGDEREDIAYRSTQRVVRVAFGQSVTTPASAGFDITMTDIVQVFSVAGGGDVNGDGRADILVGAGRNLGPTFGYVAYVIFGRANPVDVDLSQIEAGNGGFAIREAAFNDFTASIPVASAGDVNGDDLGDVLVGAPGAASNDQAGAGRAYVVFGKAATEPVDLGPLGNENGGGFMITGVDVGAATGAAVSRLGDQNGDGRSELLIGAPGSFDGSFTYVVFGKADFTTVSLADLRAGQAGGFALVGAESERAGSSVAAGDIDGDGIDDIVIGAPGNGGGAYVVFGGPS